MVATAEHDAQPRSGEGYFSKERLPQIKVTCRIKPNRVGGEVLCFNIPLGPIEIVCVANIPCDEETEAPGYVKFKFRRQGNRGPARASNNQSGWLDDGLDGADDAGADED